MEKKYNIELYNKVVGFVQAGATIVEACKKVNITSRVLYKYMTSEQKKELKVAKLMTAKYTDTHVRSSGSKLRDIKYLELGLEEGLEDID